MTQLLTQKQLADAAAHGVAIALNARNQESSGAHDAKALFAPVKLICGGPFEMFNVVLKLNEHGIVTPGASVQVQQQG